MYSFEIFAPRNQRKASDALEKGQLGQAVNEGTRAQRQLDAVRDQLRRESANKFGEEMKDLRQQAGQLDDKQKELTKQLEEPQKPKPPTDLAVFALSDDTSLISWEFSALAETYTVKRAESSGGEYTVIAEGLTTPEFIDPEAGNGSVFYYVITAVNTAGASADSDEFVFDPNAE